MLNYLLAHTPLFYFVQSLWRDEAFSILAAKESLTFIVTKLGFEPPVYYTLLHFWIKVFGTSELAARSLSFIGLLLATIIVIEWADQVYKKHWLAWYVPLFFFLNPMLLYYAFEVRTYGWFIFFATATLYTYATNRWRWFFVSALLGFYTHVYMLPYIAALAIHRLWAHRTHIFRNPNKIRSFFVFLFTDPGMKSIMLSVIFMIPWLIKIAMELPRMKSSWYYPVDIQLVKSALGNLFVGYEGTPWYGWKYTRYLSIFIAAGSIFALMYRKIREHAQLLVIFGMIPLAVIIGISFIKPLYVNRYLIPTTIAEILLLGAAISAIKKPLFQKLTAAAMLIGVLWFNWWFPPQHPKTPVKETFNQIQTLIKPGDIYLASDALIYLETLYYAKEASRVYLYNPNNHEFAWYIGDALFNPSRMVRDYPIYPTRAFLIRTDGTFEVIYRMPL